MVRGNVLMVIGLAGRRKGKSLCVAYSANLNPDSRIAELISSEPQAVLIPRNLPAEKSGRSVGPLFSRSATHVGKVPQSCLRELLQGFRARPFRRSRKLHFIQTIRRFGRHVYLWEGKGHKLGGGSVRGSSGRLSEKASGFSSRPGGRQQAPIPRASAKEDRPCRPDDT